MKNPVLSILSLWLVFFLLPGREVVAQTQFELSQGSSSTTVAGPTTANQSATLLENTSGTSFTTATPTTTVSLSLSNQQYTGTFGNLSTGVVYGATVSSTNSVSAASTAVFQSMSAVGGSGNGSFTSSPCGPAGTGIDVNANYGFRLFSSTKPLGAANAATTGRYRYADITLTFNRAVDNPVLHIVGLGASNGATTLLAAQYFTTELELQTTGVTLTELSGTTEFNVTADNKILNSAAQPNGTCGSGAACGSVRVNGTGITTLTFRLFVRGVSGGLIGGLASSWDPGATGHSGDAFIIGVSLDKAPVPTATTVFNACPTTTANLTAVQPAGTTFEWHTVASNPSAATRVSNPASVSAAGTYYLYSVPSANCYSPASVPVTVGIQPCTACALIFNTDFEANQVSGSTFNIVDESLVPSWSTTASDSRIEVWRTGYQSVPSYSGLQFIELNANVASTLYQNFTAPGGSSYTLNFAHRGRSGVDVMSVAIGSPIASTVNSGTVVTGTIYNNLGNYSDGNTAWGYYSVTFTLPTGVGSNFSLRFNSISATGGNTSIGNFLDAISISDIAPTLTSTSLVTTCPATTASLSSFTATNLPVGSTQTYHTGPVATDANKVTNINAVGSGIYYTSFFNPTKQCYGATTAINVTVAPCPAPNSGTVCAGTGGTAVANVAANDLVNGQAATLGSGGNATVATVGTYPAGISLNTTTGAINVATTTAAGNYTVVYQLCNRLTPVTCATSTVAIAVNPLVNATLSSATICSGASATLTAGGGDSYLFSTGTTNTNGQLIVTPTALDDTPYSVTVTSALGCTAVANGTVTVNPSVTATLSSATICNGTSTTLTATGGSTYRFSTGLTNTTGVLVVAPTTNGSNVYSVTVTSAQGCSATASGTVTVNPSVTATLSSATICNGTSATLTATGGSNYRFSEGTTNTSGVLIVAPTTNGSNPYSVTVTSALGCSATASGTVTVNPSVTATLSSATICNGTSTTLTATGGSSYRFNTGLTNTSGLLTVTPTANGNNPYSVTVTSAQGCSAVANGTVTVNPSVTATLSVATICNGTSATLTATGGTNYRFSEGTTNSSGVLVVAPTTNGSNVYSVTVTSAQGCSATASGTVTVNPSVTATLSSATICNGTSATLTATGGSSYRFGPGQTNTTGILVVSPTTVGANPYSVTVTSSQGCTAVANATVTVNPLPQPSISGSTSVCAGQPISLTASPTTGLTYVWSGPGGFTSTSNPLTIANSTSANSGAYRVVVTDVNGCTATASQNVTVKPVPQVQILNTSITCANNMPAVVISTQVTGGTPPVSYAWYRSGAAGVISTSPNPAFSTADTYSVVVTDASGCVSNTATVTIMEPDPLAVNIQTANPRCFSALGTITVTVNGGGAPYTVSYRNASGPISSSSTSSVSTLQAAAGSYTVVVTDANGCSLTQTATLTQPTQLSLTLTGGGPVCAGQTTGTISSSVAGGTPSYSYLWSTGATTPNLTGLSGGSYSVVVTDANSCTIAGSTTLPVNPLPATPTVNVTQPTCVTVTGTITVLTPASGVQYSFDNGTSYQVSPSRAGLAPDVYLVRVRDNTTGCASLPTSVTVNPVPNPPVVSIAGATTLCAGQPISLTASPTTNVTYVWSGPGGVSGTTNPFVIASSSPANSGIYRVVVTDVNGCTATASTNVLVNPVPVATLVASSTAVCFGQSINLTAGGGSGYVFSANVSGVSGNTASFTAGVGTAQYSVTVTSGQGCTAVASTSVTVNPTPQLTVNSVSLCAGSAATLTVGGCSGGTLVWSTGDNTASLAISPSVTTIYSATCTLTTGCSATISTTVTVSPSPSYDITPVPTSATCTGLVAGNNARIDLTTLRNTERADISLGSTYAGPVYGAASNRVVGSGAVSFTGIANPTNPQAYTIRLFSAGGTCFTDLTVVVNPANCQCPIPACVPVAVSEVR